MASEGGRQNAALAVAGMLCKAGYPAVDVITAVNGRIVTSRPDLRLQISQINPGSEIMMSVVRDGHKIELPVILASLNDASIAEDSSAETIELLPGVNLLEMSDALREKFRIGQTVQGLVISEVSGDSDHSDDLKSLREGIA